MEKQQKLNALFTNEAFKAEADKISTAEELQELFAKYGVEMTLDEVIDLCGVIARYMQSEDSEELSEDDLDNVAGGIAWLAIGVAVLCIGALAIGIYNGYQSCKKK